MKKIRIWDRKKAIEAAAEQERAQQRRVTAFSHLLSDICRFKLCILATYPSDPNHYEIPETRFEAFSNIRSDLHRILFFIFCAQISKGYSHEQKQHHSC